MWQPEAKIRAGKSVEECVCPSGQPSSPPPAPTFEKASDGLGESTFVVSAAFLEPSGPLLALFWIHYS